MAHYAFLDENNIVTDVIVGRDENDLVDGITNWEEYYASERGQICKRTSYNTKENSHLLGGIPFRGNYAGIGYKYDKELDVFIPPQPFISWKLNYKTFQWEPPVLMPEPEEGYIWEWKETNQEWVKIPLD